MIDFTHTELLAMDTMDQVITRICHSLLYDPATWYYTMLHTIEGAAA